MSNVKGISTEGRGRELASKVSELTKKHGREVEMSVPLTLGALRGDVKPYADLPDDTDILVLAPNGKIVQAQTVLVVEDDDTGKLGMLFSCLPREMFVEAMIDAAGGQAGASSTKH